jgi:hypothetical protein
MGHGSSGRRVQVRGHGFKARSARTSPMCSVIGFMLGAGNWEAWNVLERLLANGALSVGPDFAFHPLHLRLDLVEKIG